MAVLGSVLATLILGTIPQLTDTLLEQAQTAARNEAPSTQPATEKLAAR